MPSVDFKSKRVQAVATMAMGAAFKGFEAIPGIYLPVYDVPSLGPTPFADAFLLAGAGLWLIGVGHAIQKVWAEKIAAANKPEVTS